MTPKRLIDRLDIHPDTAVVVLGVSDPAFWGQLHERVRNVEQTADRTTDMVIFLAERREDIIELEKLRRTIRHDGTIWVVYPKGALRGGVVPTTAEVLDAGRSVGLLDTKTLTFSATHAAIRFIVPRTPPPAV